MSDTGIRVEEYIDKHGRSAFGTFFDDLSFAAAAKVTGVIEKLAQGHTSGLKTVGGGVAEWRLDWGPGIRVYLHQDGATLVLLMGGSYGKGSQSEDIAAAQALVADYKRRKKRPADIEIKTYTAGQPRGGRSP